MFAAPLIVDAPSTLLGIEIAKPDAPAFRPVADLDGPQAKKAAARRFKCRPGAVRRAVELHNALREDRRPLRSRSRRLLRIRRRVARKHKEDVVEQASCEHIA